MFPYLKIGNRLLKASKEVLCSHRIGFFGLHHFENILGEFQCN